MGDFPVASDAALRPGSMLLASTLRPRCLVINHLSSVALQLSTIGHRNNVLVGAGHVCLRRRPAGLPLSTHNLARLVTWSV